MSRHEYYNKAKKLGYKGQVYWPYGDKKYWKDQADYLEKPLIYIPISYIAKILGYCDCINPKISKEYLDKLVYFNKNRVSNGQLIKMKERINTLPREVLLEKINNITDDRTRYTKLGYVYEDDGIKLYKKKIYIDCEMEEQKELNYLYETKNFNIMIIGKCDLFNETLNEVIEIKSRMKRLRGCYYDSEEIQVQFYLHCLRIREGKILEHYKGEYNIFDVIYNKKKVNNYIIEIMRILKESCLVKL